MQSMKFFRTLAIVGALGVFATVPMRADFFFNTSGPSGDPVSGTANFHFTATTLVLTLTNTSDAGHIDQLLDGFSFILTGGTLTDSTLAVSFANPGNHFALCSDTSYPCAESTTFTGMSSPYGWSSSADCLGAGGCGTWKPDGILNSDFNTSPDCGGMHKGDLCNGPHNPYLLGPVNFTWTFVPNPTVPLGVSGVTFDWGTGPRTTEGTPGTPPGIPEPTSVVLFGTVLVGTATALRRRFQSAKV